MTLVLVRGIGDVGSAVAHRLFGVGYAVIIHDAENPAYGRRGMAFADAMFDGKAELAGVLAKCARDTTGLNIMVKCRRAIPVASGELSSVIEAFQPDVLVDARMRKRYHPENQRDLAPLTVGLGPNFVAGAATDVVIETAWGPGLGSIIRQGASLPLHGEPQSIAGHARDRYLYAETAGVFVTAMQIGDPIKRGDIVGSIDGQIILAPLTGRLRGLTRSGVRVEKGTKIVEVDPRNESAIVRGLGERPKRIAEGVLEAINGRIHARTFSLPGH